MENDCLIVFCTVPPEIAGDMAQSIVESKLAACCSIIPPVQSVYRWKGKVMKQAENMLVIKTLKERFGDLEKHIVRVHPYEVPEIMAVKIEDGSSSYLDWIRENSSL